MTRTEGSYVPGDGVAIVTTRWTALVLADRAHPTVELLVELGFGSDDDPDHDPAPAETVLEELGRQGFDLLPPLGVTAWSAETCRLLLRGGLVADVNDLPGATPAVVDSAGVLTWSEHLLTDASTVTLRAPSTEPAAGAGFWTIGGVVAAERITSGPSGSVSVPRVHTDPATPDAAAGGPPDPPRRVTADADPASVAPAWTHPVSTQTPPGEPSDGPEGGAADGPTGGADDGHTLVPPPEPEPIQVEVPPSTELEAPDRPADRPSPPPLTPPVRSTPEPPTSVAAPPEEPADDPDDPDDPDVPDDPGATDVTGVNDDGGDYDHLFGSTIVRSVEDAAVRDAPVSGAGPDVPGDQADRNPDHPTDHDGMTITVSELRRLRQSESGEPAGGPPPPPADANPDGEHVTRQCQAGHLNPPQATACRVCGRPVDGETFRVDRVELGTFRFSSGRLVPVAGTMLIGRSPKPPTNATGPVELIEVPSPAHDISRTHLEVRVEGWQVLVIDRGSTNGTVITIPGRQPQRLRAGEPFPLPVGGSVNLADEAEFTYEVGA